MPVSTEDYVSISDHFARYCWAVDEGDEDGWIALWAEDGVRRGLLDKYDDEEGLNGSDEDEFRVVGAELVLTPAGTFDALRVEGQAEGLVQVLRARHLDHLDGAERGAGIRQRRARARLGGGGGAGGGGGGMAQGGGAGIAYGGGGGVVPCSRARATEAWH